MPVNVTTWLRGLGLEQYAAAFVENEVDELSLPSLTAEDLRNLGVTAIGHQRRLLEAIAALRAETSGADVTIIPPRKISTIRVSDRESRWRVAMATLRQPDLGMGAAERRPLTVMFCDIVGSTSLSTQIDPEDLRDLINAYHKVIAETVASFDGFVAQYLGDGVLIYFGYPQAHADDAEGAVRAGLAVIHATAKLSGSVTLQVRIGIATDIAVVGDLIGDGGSPEIGAEGGTPNLAARVVTLAISTIEPNTIVISEGTRRLVGGLFDLEDLGLQELEGFGEPQHAWRVLGESGVASQFESLRSGETPHRRRHRHHHRRSRSKSSLLNLLIPVGLVGLIPLLWLVFSNIETPTQNDTTTKTAGTASAPAQQSTQRDAQSVQDDQDRPLQPRRADLETRMGRVFEKDQYYLDKNLGDQFQGEKGKNADLNRPGPRVPHSKLVPVDDKLTAEEVFSSRNKDEVQIPGPMFNVRSLTAEALSEREWLRYLGLVRIHRMAALTLYDNLCSDRPTGEEAEALTIVENQFKKLPRDVQEKALDHQTKAIESRPDPYHTNENLVASGGFAWFCNKMTDGINSGYADPMFKTAREGFFPIEGD